MNIRLAASLCACLMMAGCSFLPKFGDLLSFSGGNDDDAGFPSEPVVAAATPVPTASGQVDPFCLAVAAQGGQEGGFDQATQQRMAQRDYKQCVTLHRSP